MTRLRKATESVGTMNSQGPLGDPVTAREHDWVDKADPRMARWPSLRDTMRPDWHMCITCGVIRRVDGPNKPCRGAVRIVLRDESEKAEMEGINPKEINTARDAFAATYERLITEGCHPNSVVIGLSEIVAHCVAFKAVSGGSDAAYRAWLVGFEAAYRQELQQQRESIK